MQPYVPFVVVSTESLASDDPDDLIGSNIEFVNQLRSEALLELEELCRDALLSYNVDLYLAQVMNGGFSQFVWNTCWDELLVELVREGLAAVGAHRHRHVFDAGAGIVATLGAERLAVFIEGEYFASPNAERDALNALNDEFWQAAKQENLTALNGAWLRSLPNLVAQSADEMQQLIGRVAAQVPDRAERLARADGDEPAYLMIIKSLCDRAGHTFDQVTAGNPAYEYEGHRTVGWHFYTDHGHYVALQPVDGGALMIDAGSKSRVAELSAAAVDDLIGDHS